MSTKRPAGGGGLDVHERRGLGAQAATLGAVVVPEIEILRSQRGEAEVPPSRPGAERPGVAVRAEGPGRGGAHVSVPRTNALIVASRWPTPSPWGRMR